jgi:hypothetical protein
MGLLFKTLAFFCAIFAFTGSASAALVDWSALNWPAGSLSNSYDVDPASAGNDVTVTSGPGARNGRCLYSNHIGGRLDVGKPTEKASQETCPRMFSIYRDEH